MVRDLARAREVVIPSDADLAVRAAGGEGKAFDELYRRHADAAWRVAMAVAGNAHDAADAVAEAFADVFRALPAGRLKADVPFRPYLLKATRNAAIDTLRRGQRVQPTHELGDLDSESLGVGPSERLMMSEDGLLVADAFRRLPERWRTVLWLTEIEGLPAREVAAVLGMSANAVSQLAVRAKAGLRRNYLQAHVGNGVDRGCRHTVDRLGAYVAGALPRRDVAKVERHLETCGACQTRLADLEDLGSTLRRSALPIPLALGAAAAGKWKGALTSAAGAGRKVGSVAARKALSGATAAVLGLGITAAVVRTPASTHSPRLAAPPSASAPGNQTVQLTSADPQDGEAQAQSVTASAPHAMAATQTTGNRQPDPTAASAPRTSKPDALPPGGPSSRPVPTAQVNVSGNVGVTGVTVAGGVGPGSCTALALSPTTTTCADPRTSPGVTASAVGGLLPTPFAVSLP